MTGDDDRKPTSDQQDAPPRRRVLTRRRSVTFIVADTSAQQHEAKALQAGTRQDTSLDIVGIEDPRQVQTNHSITLKNVSNAFQMQKYSDFVRPRLIIFSLTLQGYSSRLACCPTDCVKPGVRLRGDFCIKAA